MLETNRRELTPRFLRLIEEGQRDGSISTGYAPELAELIPLLTSLWLAPTVYPATPEGMLRKFRLIGEALAALGLPAGGRGGHAPGRGLRRKALKNRGRPSAALF